MQYYIIVREPFFWRGGSRDASPPRQLCMIQYPQIRSKGPHVHSVLGRCIPSSHISLLHGS